MSFFLGRWVDSRVLTHVVEIKSKICELILSILIDDYNFLLLLLGRFLASLHSWLSDRFGLSLLSFFNLLLVQIGIKFLLHLLEFDLLFSLLLLSFSLKIFNNVSIWRWILANILDRFSVVHELRLNIHQEFKSLFCLQGIVVVSKYSIHIFDFSLNLLA